MRGVIGRGRLLSPRSARGAHQEGRGLVTTFSTASRAGSGDGIARFSDQAMSYTPAMDLGAVSAAFGAALLASGIAYLGARQLQNEAIRHRERGQTRAVYFEVGKIGTDIELALDSGQSMPNISTATYDQAAADVAMFLTPRDFDTVALAYYLLSHYVGREETDEVDPAGLRNLRVVLDHVEAAREVLKKAAYSKGELTARGISPGALS
jgi:hypothetical protein